MSTTPPTKSTIQLSSSDDDGLDTPMASSAEIPMPIAEKTPADTVTPPKRLIKLSDDDNDDESNKKKDTQSSENLALSNSAPASLDASRSHVDPLDHSIGSIKSPNSVASPSSRRSAQQQLTPLTIPDVFKKVPRSRIKLEDNKAGALGTGGFARVVKAQLLPDESSPSDPPRPVAVKIVDRQRALTSSFVNMQLEIDVCAMLSHQCIVNTIAVWEDATNIYIVMDLAEKGELLQYMKRFGLEDMPEVAPKFLGEVILGLEYMQSRGVVHRDIKPENLLLTSEFHVKIADFGTACEISSSENNKMTGTAQYVSPEVIHTGKATPTSDVWALGCLLYQLMVGSPPFKGDSEYLILQSVKAMQYSFPPYFPADAKDLVSKMLEPDPTKRIGAKGFGEIKAHPFFKGVAWDDLLKQSNVTYLNKDHNTTWQALLLKNENIVFTTLTSKERHLSKKERHLILTDYPRLFYVKPNTFKIKGTVPWSDQLCAEAENAAIFQVHCHTDRIYYFTCLENRAHMWAAKINDMVKQKQIKKAASPRAK